MEDLKKYKDSDYEEFVLSPSVLKSKRKIPEPLDGEEETKPAPMAKKRKLVPVPKLKTPVKPFVPPTTKRVVPKISPNVPLHKQLKRQHAKMDIIPGSESEEEGEVLESFDDSDNSSEGVSIFEVNDSEDEEPEDISEDLGEDYSE